VVKWKSVKTAASFSCERWFDMSDVHQQAMLPVAELPPAERSAQTSALFARIDESPDDAELTALKQEIAELNLGVVQALARRYRGRGEALEDLEQAGCVGLMKAINGFRPDRGAEFMTYAIPTISGELKKHFRDHCWTVRPTRRIQELQAAVTGATEAISQELGRTPTLGDLAEALDQPADDLGEAVAAHGCYSPKSLDAPLPSGESPFAAVLGHDDGGFDTAEAHVVLVAAIRKLPERDRQILGMRFFHDLTQRQIAAEVGTTQMQVSRVLTRIMTRLREELASSPGR
jgi:RNA polymerase sigma-B factor